MRVRMFLSASPSHTRRRSPFIPDRNNQRPGNLTQQDARKFFQCISECSAHFHRPSSRSTAGRRRPALPPPPTRFTESAAAFTKAERVSSQQEEHARVCRHVCCEVTNAIIQIRRLIITDAQQPDRPSTTVMCHQFTFILREKGLNACVSLKMAEGFTDDVRLMLFYC